jgi:HAD superfamily hydrolase (TIGR01509 family)
MQAVFFFNLGFIQNLLSRIKYAIIYSGDDILFSVIFDMDGTLLDTQRICIPAWDYAGELQGFKNMGSHIPNVCGMSESGWTSYLKENFKGLNIDAFVCEARRYTSDNGKVVFKKGAVELVEFLKLNGIKIGLASGSSRNSINHNLNQLNAFDFFDTVVAGHDVANGKPAPDIFSLTAEKMKVNPEDCFVFEDSSNGVRAAIAAGMKCIGVPDIVDFSSEIQKLLFAKLNDLSEAIEILKPYLY